MAYRPDDLPALVDPRHTAVLVVDVQKWFTRPRPTPLFPPLEDVLPRLSWFVAQARATGVPVICIRIVQGDETYSDVWRRQFRAAWGSASPLAPETEGAGFHPGFEPEPGDIVVTKHRYSAFFGTPLESILRGRGVRTVVVGGLTTDVCVAMTARDAFQHEFQAVTLEDCTAEVTRESHEAGLATLSRNFGDVCAAADVVNAWAARTVPAGV